MEVVVGDGGEEARPPEMGSSPATWPERRRLSGGRLGFLGGDEEEKEMRRREKKEKEKK